MGIRPGLDYPGLSVVFVCHDGHGSFVMAKRGDQARDERGTWDVGGGAIELGQTVEDALENELWQEYGAIGQNTLFMGYRNVLRTQNGAPYHWSALDFLVQVEPSCVINGEPGKFDELGWFHLGHLPAPLHSAVPDLFDRHHQTLRDGGIFA